MSKIHIATSRDLEQINDVVSAHNNESPIYFQATNFEAYDFEQRDRQIIFVARNKELIIGFLSLHCENSFMNDRDIAEFEVVVHPDYRRRDNLQSDTRLSGKKGTATDLIKEAINYLRKNTKINRLESLVKKENVRAKKLVDKIGFSVSEFQRGYSVAMNINH